VGAGEEKVFWGTEGSVDARWDFGFSFLALLWLAFFRIL
jgi:hypothetical protein